MKTIKKENEYLNHEEKENYKQKSEIISFQKLINK